MRSGKTWAAVVRAHELGYRVQEDGSVLSPKGRVRKLSLTGRAGALYWRFNSLGENGVVYRIGVHILVAIQLYGVEAVRRADCVRHANGDSADNSFANILIGTHQENAMDRAPEARRAHARKASDKNPPKLTPDDVREIRRARDAGALLQDLARAYGVTKSTIWYCVKGRTHATL